MDQPIRSCSPSLRLLLCLAMVHSACRGQDPGSHVVARDTIPSAQQIDDYVIEIFEDTRGRLWFGTLARGAACYDRRSLTYLTTRDGLCGNDVVSIAEDREGSMWFGTHTGATRYDGRSFTRYWEAEGLHGSGCNLLVDRRGTLWAGTNHGLFRFDGRAFDAFPIPVPSTANLSWKVEAGKVWCLMEDSRGRLWFGLDGYGAWLYDGSTFRQFTRKDGLCSDNVAAITEDRQGNIWFGSLTSDAPMPVMEGGLAMYDGHTIRQFPHVRGLAENDIIRFTRTGADMCGSGRPASAPTATTARHSPSSPRRTGRT